MSGAPDLQALQKFTSDVFVEALLALAVVLGTVLICLYFCFYFGVGGKPALPEDVAQEDVHTQEQWTYWALSKRGLFADLIAIGSGLAIVWFRVIGSVAWEMAVVGGISVLVWIGLGCRSLRQRIWLVCLIVWLSALTASYIRWPPGSPKRLVRDFVTKVNRGDCEGAWQYFSRDAQRAIEGEAERRRRQSPDHLKGWNDELLSAHNLYCKPNGVNPYVNYEPRSVALLAQTENRARVSVKQGQATGFLIPGFFPTKTIWHDREVQLVREGGEWKLSRP